MGSLPDQSAGPVPHYLVLPLLVLSLFGQRLSAQYCSERPGGCCPGRDDTCTVAKADALPCYCDMYCLRTNDPDCCPDLFTFCMDPSGQAYAESLSTSTSDCVFQNHHLYAGESFKMNCNTCTCLPTVNGGYQIQCEQDVCLIRQVVIDRVNSENNGWRAKNYTSWWGLSLGEGMKYRLGTIQPLAVVTYMNKIHIRRRTDLPENFDSRQKWPGWISGIMDQGDCGSSWAVSTVAVASDRLAIQSKGRIRSNLSAQNLLSCNARRQRGCNGGHLDRAWHYMRKYGLVTDECYPYKSGLTEAGIMNSYSCLIPRDQTSRCPGNNITTSRKYQTSPPYRISQKEEDIKTEILRNGPVQALFLVKEDFYCYAGGVYKYTRDVVNDQGKMYGYHSVRIIGWGVDRTNPHAALPYWLCANSWGRDWGEGGYFRVLRGTNECEIEAFVLAAWARVYIGLRRG